MIVSSGKPQKYRNNTNTNSQTFNVDMLQQLPFKVNVFHGAPEPSKKNEQIGKFPKSLNLSSITMG